MRRHRRTLGIPLVVAALLLARFDSSFLRLSVPLIVLGETIRIWAAGHLRKEEFVTTGGPYRVVRNPLYLGSFWIAVGFCLVANSIWVWILMTAYFALCYVPVIKQEESVLREKFPSEYFMYASAVPAFFPTLRMYPSTSTKFSWRQVLRNKEYNAVLGILIAYAYLVLVSWRLGDL